MQITIRLYEVKKLYANNKTQKKGQKQWQQQTVV